MRCAQASALQDKIHSYKYEGKAGWSLIFGRRCTIRPMNVASQVAVQRTDVPPDATGVSVPSAR